MGEFDGGPDRLGQAGNVNCHGLVARLDSDVNKAFAEYYTSRETFVGSALKAFSLRENRYTTMIGLDVRQEKMRSDIHFRRIEFHGHSVARFQILARLAGIFKKTAQIVGVDADGIGLRVNDVHRVGFLIDTDRS